MQILRSVKTLALQSARYFSLSLSLYIYIYIYREREREKYLALCKARVLTERKICISLNRIFWTEKKYFSFYQKTKTTFVTHENHENDFKNCSEGIRDVCHNWSYKAERKKFFFHDFLNFAIFKIFFIHLKFLKLNLSFTKRKMMVSFLRI